MRLVETGLTGRAFLIQYLEVMREFGDVIPWLSGLDNLQFATNGAYFRDSLLRNVGQRDGGVTPYQFIENGRAGIYIGGILLFGRSPERFRDRRNAAVAERLSNRSRFISCLQVRPPHRGRGVGRRMMDRALGAIRKEQGPVWGVVSDPRLLPFYRGLGADTPSPAENRDGLWIVSWDKTQSSGSSS